MTKPIRPKKLPWCAYPKATEVQGHGLLFHKKDLPVVDFERALPYRSAAYTIKPTKNLDTSQILALAHVISSSFATNEPMNKHVHPPRQPHKQLINVTHQDVFGNHPFGSWTKENLLYWFVRLNLITKTSHPKGAIQKNNDVIGHSLVITNKDSKPIGGSLNSRLPHKKEKERHNDPFLEATFSYQYPILNFIYQHEGIAIQTLDDCYPHFKKAHQSGKVGYIAMIARSNELPSEDTFELFASSFENFQKLGYEYMLITGTNQWTGAACEVLGAARIYFAPFRDKTRVAKENEADQNEPFSSDGFISGKDSGLMVYALKLKND